MQTKYHRIQRQKSARNSEGAAKTFIDQILINAHEQIFSKNVLGCCKTYMAKQIVSAENQSIQQIRSHSPNPPNLDGQDNGTDKRFYDTFRPYSAKVERVSKIYTTTPSSISRPTSFKGSIYKSMQSFKSLKSAKSMKSIKQIGTYKHRQEQSQLSKYKSRLIPLVATYSYNQESDSFVDQLRRNKIKAQQYEKQKQNFLSSITKQNKQYIKKQSKFASSLTRKQYTYSQTGQIMEITNQTSKLKKRSNNNQSKMTGLANKAQQQANKSKNICVSFAKRDQKPEHKDYVFGDGAERLRTEMFCPSNTFNTKYTLKAEDY